MFLVHFVGDVHQPLHVGLEADEGGNTIIIHWYRRKTNLHHVWDSNIIETALKDFYRNDQSSMIEAISKNITVNYTHFFSFNSELKCLIFFFSFNFVSVRLDCRIVMLIAGTTAEIKGSLVQTSELNYN